MSDVLRIEVWRHQLSAVADEMGATLQRAAYSANIKERLDFSCAVFDADGQLLAQAAHIPVHLGAMPASVSAARGRWPDWSPGDVVLLNDPYAGGSHLPDLTTVSPVFAGGREPAAFVATRAHHADVGGAAPGSMPLVRELVAEGLVIPPVRLLVAGRLDEGLLDLIAANSRLPEERRGDLAAQIAAQQLGAQRLGQLAAVSDFAARCRLLLDYSADRARRRLASQLVPGRYAFSDAMESDGFTEQAVPIQVAVDVAADGALAVDFSGTAPQTSGGINAPLAVTQAAVYYLVACLLGDVPLNAGAFRSIGIHVPAGSLLNPRPGAAVAAGNVETSQRLVDVLMGALGQAVAGGLPAASQGTMNNVLIGGWDSLRQRPFTYYETLGGGAGGGPDGPGASGWQVHMTNTRNTPVEALEVAYPLRVEAYHLRDGSGGAGRQPGGDGLVRRIRLLVPAQVTVLSERRAWGPWGVAGGGAGAPGANQLSIDEHVTRLAAKVSFDAPGEAVLDIATPGGGGWGSPVGASSQKRQQVEDHQQRRHPSDHVDQQ
jgi:N-methylhydantoinase B